MTADPERARAREEGIALVKPIAAGIWRDFHRTLSLDDLIQEGFLGLLRAYDARDPARPESFAAYARCRIRGAVLDQMRAECERLESFELPDSAAAPPPDPRRSQLTELLERLTDRQRSVILLGIAGHSQTEIALALHSNRAAVSRTHARAVRRLRQMVRTGYLPTRLPLAA